MTWVAWRLQRTEMLIAAGIVVALTLILLPSGLEMAHAYSRDGLGACLAHPTDACGQTVDAFVARFHSTGSLVAWMTLLPGLIGVLLATPFVLDLENGTYRLAWTQSITRGRWIAGKLALAVGAAVVGALALTLLMTWWRTPLVHIDGRIDPSAFDSQGTVVARLHPLRARPRPRRRHRLAPRRARAHRRVRRVLRLAALRRHVAAAEVRHSAVGDGRASCARPRRRSWTTPGSSRQWPSDRLGHHVSPPGRRERARRPARRLEGVRSVAASREHGGGYMHTVFQPASRFWELQGIETALFGGTALLLIAFAAWWAHERTA